ncbi:hypothetical protein [Anaerocolumna xylanovorans]|uniref:Flavodoxin domain-containing protein n=1 Tax=Anaerocolumna xylanovorans DSM 12503 TaxID=1121345 RepID=A0A1M7XW99_9FIRM|nr:hypothetical protein [Anaerocolumna xylanovorans]SHO42995.1 hypothetical protein SAMN02745217_00051 [Anaerocolumna xylanovorans DSM 12503]
MQSVKTIHLMFFSGTGGTALIAGNLEKIFLEKGILISKAELPLKGSLQYEADLLLILYPVYAFNAPKLLEEWISSLPRGKKQRSSVISVSGGGEISPNTACRVRIIRQLEQKGFHVFYENMLVMPSNFMISYDDIVSAMLLRVLPLKAKNVAEEILSGKQRRTKPLAADRLFSRMGLLEYLEEFYP